MMLFQQLRNSYRTAPLLNAIAPWGWASVVIRNPGFPPLSASYWGWAPVVYNIAAVSLPYFQLTHGTQGYALAPYTSFVQSQSEPVLYTVAPWGWPPVISYPGIPPLCASYWGWAPVYNIAAVNVPYLGWPFEPLVSTGTQGLVTLFEPPAVRTYTPDYNIGDVPYLGWPFEPLVSTGTQGLVPLFQLPAVRTYTPDYNIADVPYLGWPFEPLVSTGTQGLVLEPVVRTYTPGILVHRPGATSSHGSVPAVRSSTYLGRVQGSLPLYHPVVRPASPGVPVYGPGSPSLRRASLPLFQTVVRSATPGRAHFAHSQGSSRSFGSEPPRPFPCYARKCGKSFDRTSELSEHYEHEHPLIYQTRIHCNKCLARFAKKADLIQHKPNCPLAKDGGIRDTAFQARIYEKKKEAEKAKPFVCPVRECRGKRFKKLEDLANHFLHKHKGIHKKITYCYKCLSFFASRAELRAHKPNCKLAKEDDIRGAALQARIADEAKEAEKTEQADQRKGDDIGKKAEEKMGGGREKET